MLYCYLRLGFDTPATPLATQDGIKSQSNHRITEGTTRGWQLISDDLNADQ
jgi:hypothetical protein